MSTPNNNIPLTSNNNNNNNVVGQGESQPQSPSISFALPQSTKNKIIIPTTKEGLCWSSRRFQTEYPDALDGYMTKPEFDHAVDRLQTTWFRTKMVYWCVSVALPLVGLFVMLLSFTLFKKNGAVLVGGVLILFIGLCISCFGFMLITNKYLYHLHIEIQVLNTKFSRSGIVWSLHLFEYYKQSTQKKCMELWVEVDLPATPIVNVNEQQQNQATSAKSICIQSGDSFEMSDCDSESISSDFTFDSNSYTSHHNINNNPTSFISIDIQSLPSWFEITNLSMDGGLRTYVESQPTEKSPAQAMADAPNFFYLLYLLVPTYLLQLQLQLYITSSSSSYL
ncbi:hypothetical protein DFA_07824 [Cavenderia fasciculata]|uniref:Transmembrane protein n=1 Tax=Cavenderia fasciculata TaxID=261658 RepID=F4Q3H6_CACFS|nr:uncharacterized protein DFA_07824 [Cavenderia fasciculata]EGG16845.1 hypothetical protein DFA_07824 [Cavenderia fasciculata]|eukprot:XP_004355319.1 hypothetical protein DFA_07824 [Cavenderia fasciculata]